MKDLTQGPISKQLIAMAVPIAVGMLFQTLYLLVDLYFVSGLGDAAIAGVSSAATATMLIMALTQMLGVGTVTLISHAVGRKDQPEANLVFNQSVLLSAICGAVTLAAGYLLSAPYMRAIAADPAVVAGGHHLPLLVRARAGAAVRAGGTRLGAARHRHRQSQHGRADADGDPEHHPGPDPDQRLGHAPPHGRGGGGAGEQPGDRLRRAMPVDLLRTPRALRGRARRAVGAARGAHPPPPERRPAGGRRVFHDVPDPGHDLLADPRLRAGGAGRLRRRHARDAGAVPAGHGGGVRRGAGRRAELRRAPVRPRARDLPRRGADEFGTDAGAHPGVPVAPGVVHRALHHRRGRGGGRRALPAHHLVEFRGQRADLHLLGHVPGGRQHLAVAGELRLAAHHLPGAGGRACRGCRTSACRRCGTCRWPP